MTAVVDSYTKTFVPAALFKQIVSTIGAQYEFASDEYVVACSAVKNLPDLVLTFDGGFKYRVPTGEYVKNLVPRKDNKCTLLIAEIPNPLPGDDSVIVLGWQMLSSYCWRFDYGGANELAVAKSKPL